MDHEQRATGSIWSLEAHTELSSSSLWLTLQNLSLSRSSVTASISLCTNYNDDLYHNIHQALRTWSSLQILIIQLDGYRLHSLHRLPWCSFEPAEIKSLHIVTTENVGKHRYVTYILLSMTTQRTKLIATHTEYSVTGPPRIAYLIFYKCIFLCKDNNGEL